MSLSLRDTPSQAAVSKKKFPKSARLLRRDAFLQLRHHSIRLHGTFLGLQYRRGAPTVPTRLGITVSKKFGKAHERNHFKRLVREAFRALYSRLPLGLEINIYPHKPLPSFSSALGELTALFSKIH